MVGYVEVLTLRLGVYTLFGKNKIKFGQKFFASPKICTSVHLWVRVMQSLLTPRCTSPELRLLSTTITDVQQRKVARIFNFRPTREQILHWQWQCGDKEETLNSW